MTRSVGLRVGFGIVLAATLLALLVAVTYRNTRDLIEAARWVEHTHDAIGESESLLSELKDAERQARAYLLTGRSESLTLYRASLAEVGPTLDRLTRLTADSPNHLERYRQLRVEIAEEEELLRQAIALRDRQGLGALTQGPLIEAEDGKMAQLRDLVSQIQVEERQLLRSRTERTAHAARTTVLTLSLGGILLFAFLALIWALVRFDLLKRHAAESKLRASVAELDTTLRSIGDAVLATDVHGRVTLMNPVAEALTGWKEHEAVGREVGEIFRILEEFRREEVESPVTRVLREGTVVGLANHTILISRDGTEKPIADSGAPIRDDTGNVTGVVLVFRDITEKREAERDIHRLASIVSSSEDAIVAETLDGTITAWNAAAERLFGYSAEEVIGRSIEILEPPTPAEAAAVTLLRIRRGERVRYDTTRRRKDGQRVAVSITVSPIRDAQRMIVGASKIARDIGDRKRAEELLRASEQRFRSLSDSVSSLVWVADAQGEATYRNRRWYDYTGLSPSESLGTSWKSVVHPDDLSAALEGWRKAVESGEPYECELRFRAADGSYRWFMTRAERFQSPTGPIWIGNSTDIDALKASAAEIEKARKAAEQANTAKDRFLAVLSHELRTPLTPVLVSAQILEKRGDLSSDTHRSIELIRRNIELEALLVDDLLDLTRISRGKIELRREPIDLDVAIQNVTDICRSEILAKRQSLRIELQARERYADADPARVQQVLWNLIKNATKFTPEGGAIIVRSENPRRGVFRVSVIDTGIGISPDLLPRVFDAFEQGPTGPSARQAGLGLGLSISKALVELHGGTIRAESAGTDCGSTFVVELAAVGERRSIPRSERSERRTSRQRPLRILVVEDHADTAVALAQLLQSESHKVETAGTIAEALRAAERDPFDMFITDLGLPDGSGHDLMARLRTIRPIPGIVLSGYGMEADVAKSAAAGFAEHLIKPINVTQLLNAIRRVAHQTRSAQRRVPFPADVEQPKSG